MYNISISIPTCKKYVITLSNKKMVQSPPFFINISNKATLKNYKKSLKKHTLLNLVFIFLFENFDNMINLFLYFCISC